MTDTEISAGGGLWATVPKKKGEIYDRLLYLVWAEGRRSSARIREREDGGPWQEALEQLIKVSSMCSQNKVPSPKKKSQSFGNCIVTGIKEYEGLEQ